ncbi:hypothetical protein CEXT_53271 [Caerostris extrusa]|uniref:Uncharacterized protein n=1 Tax=Caerostris extrusa TaxID=172846 RepID=A0AAV4XCW1_CAEEX|nr:hypothetical protein CEXT_53271 [Caerostris extrusa]
MLMMMSFIKKHLLFREEIPYRNQKPIREFSPSKWNCLREWGSLQPFRSNSIKKELSIALSAASKIETTSILYESRRFRTANW